MTKNKYKICVYAICKNESNFVKRWVSSMKEADEIFVLDTGSEDNTVKLLQENGVNVKQEIISPWRFDIARNKSLEMVPDNYDICVCTDLDEVFEKGWREKLEQIWQTDTDRLAYNYNWLLDEKNNPKVNFYIEKIHTRKNYKWTHPVHEVLEFQLNRLENKKLAREITLNHYPDSKKSRSSYLPLLELSVKESPEDDRNMHYLGREYMYYGRWNDCIDTLIKHLNLKSAKWKDERCASMRFIARSYKNLKRYDEAYMWLSKAIKEAPYLKEPYTEYGLLAYELKDYQTAISMLEKALSINKKYPSYINEVFCNDSTINDVLSICYYNIGDYEKSLVNIENAIKINPDDERLQNNKNIILKQYQNTKNN